MTRKEQLIEFRRKLEYAKFNARHYGYQLNAILDSAGFSEIERPEICYARYRSSNVWNWHYSATPKQRIAMWDNSIAHVDKLIKECK